MVATPDPSEADINIAAINIPSTNATDTSAADTSAADTSAADTTPVEAHPDRVETDKPAELCDDVDKDCGAIRDNDEVCEKPPASEGTLPDDSACETCKSLKPGLPSATLPIEPPPVRAAQPRRTLHGIFSKPLRPSPP